MAAIGKDESQLCSCRPLRSLSKRSCTVSAWRDGSIVNWSGAEDWATQAEETVIAVSNNAVTKANILVISRLLLRFTGDKASPFAPAGRFEFQSLEVSSVG